MSRFSSFAAILLLPALVLGQQAGSDAPPQTLLHVTSRLVYVDVLVRDAQGHVVQGLRKQDFQVKEDGKPQSIEFFTAHTPEPRSTTPADLAPRTEFSNANPRSADKAITIVLFDLLNTPSDDQLTARQQMLKFLNIMPAGEHMALFTLGKGLQMVQGETGSAALRAAAEKMLRPTGSSLEVSRTGAAQGSMIAANSVAQLGRIAGSTAMSRSGPGFDSQSAEVRARSTISALGQLANAMSGYAGRKSLYWLSESFPLSIDIVGPPTTGGVSGTPTQFTVSMNNLQGHFSQTSKQEMAATLNLLASARIAVYPTSVFGLATQSATAALGGPVVGGGLPDDPRGGTFTLNNLKSEMDDLARVTGGQAIFGTNDVAGATQSTFEDGATYYSLAYRPTNANWNGNFRQIEVTAEGGGSLTYRRGYFAVADGKPADTANDLETVLQPGVPEASGLRLRSQVLPPDPQHPGLQVQSTVDASDVDFTTTPDGHRHAKLAVQLIAYSDSAQQAKTLPQTSGNLNIDLDPDRYNFILKAGIAFRQQLPLKPGRYHVMLGVSDQGSHKLGTMEMPLAVPAS
jgi:VWFA-related protein